MNGFPIPLTVIVIAKNEAINIGRCLESLSNCSELIVVDDHSTDETATIAASFKARVLQHPFASFAQQRNWALQNAGVKNDWVLMLDADEVATPEFLAEVDKMIRQVPAEVVAAKVCRRTFFEGRLLRYADGFPVWIMRLVKVGQAKFHDSGHGEIAVPEVAGKMGVVHTPMLHYPFSHGLVSWMQRHVKYASREAELELAGRERASVTRLFSRQRDVRRQTLRNMSRKIPCRGSMRFIYQYVFKLGFLDGNAGYHYCRLMALYESMIVSMRDHLASQTSK